MGSTERHNALPCAVLMIAGASCVFHSSGHTINFDPLINADRIVVRTRANEIVKTITDTDQIRAAARFADAKRSGWKDPLSGPRIPQYLLQFFNGDRGLGGYGIGSDYIVSDPTVSGFWSQTVSQSEIQKLTSTLGLTLRDP